MENAALYSVPPAPPKFERCDRLQESGNLGCVPSSYRNGRLSNMQKENINGVSVRLNFTRRAIPNFARSRVRHWRRKCSSALCENDHPELLGERVGSIPVASKNEISSAKRLFIFGFGYTSYSLANSLKGGNWMISGTCRTEERREALEQCGFRTFLFNSDNDGQELQLPFRTSTSSFLLGSPGEVSNAVEKDALLELYRATHCISTVPPVADFDKDPVLLKHELDLLQAGIQGRLSWIGYCSSTGVYGDWQGDWVDEESHPRPLTKKAVARLEAEKDWLKLGRSSGIPVQVLRLGGIYGPGRSALHTVARHGQLSEKQQMREHHRFTSRIHVADICQVILASMNMPCAGRIYNVVDDNPAPRSDVLNFAQSLLERDGQISYQSRMTSHVSTNNSKEDTSRNYEVAEKRVVNQRIKEELQVQLLYPCYKLGLRAIYEDLQGLKE